ncbi:hypothetical protein [Fusobacterium polymorphum]|uniref:hypothetical protein n=1 Tax=Fusobacterium nucleatum subsp. polymorphum TaxID=76857 RepID=UPI003008ECFE
MKIGEIISIIISIIALIKSFYTDKKTHKLEEKSNKLTQGQNDLAQGQIEIQIREMIILAKSRYADLGIQLTKDNRNETLKKATIAALEEVQNAYDEACSKYIDNKVDKNRFKKLYIEEIKNIVDDPEMKQYYLMPHSKYKATLKVYDEWYNLEK